MGVKLLKEVFGDENLRLCFYCDKLLTVSEATVDHLIPKAWKGSNDRRNLRISCSPCNNDKGDRLLCEYAPYRIDDEYLEYKKEWEKGIAYLDNCEQFNTPYFKVTPLSERLLAEVIEETKKLYSE